MKNKILFVVVIVLLINVVISFSNKTNFSLEKENVKNFVANSDNATSNEKLEEYVIGVVACEMPASFNIEALKAQAVAARTNALYDSKNSYDYDWVTNVTSQCYISKDEMQEKWKDKYNYYYGVIDEAVKGTSGEIIKYNDEVIKAFYFAMTNGYTEDSKIVFGKDYPYLDIVASPENESLKSFVGVKSFSLSEIKNILSITNLSINDIDIDESNRVESINIGGKVYSGTKIRKLLGLKSTDFTIKIKDDTVYFTTKGYGHGVGMSQYGANLLANDGYKYKEIINYYYKNIDIINLYV